MLCLQECTRQLVSELNYLCCKGRRVISFDGGHPRVHQSSQFILLIFRARRSVTPSSSGSRWDVRARISDGYLHTENMSSNGYPRLAVEHLGWRENTRHRFHNLAAHIPGGSSHPGQSWIHS